MRYWIDLLTGILEDYSLSYCEREDIGFSKFYVDRSNTEPDISFNATSIDIVVMFETFLEYVDFWTPEFQYTLNKSFNIKDHNYDSNTKEVTISLTINVSKTRE